MSPERKRIPILPNLITTGNIFAGFFSIIHSIQGDYKTAAWAVVAGGILDNLDGRVARWTNGQSEFGVQYDSLSDLTTFGFAPALLAYFWALEDFGRLGWLAAFLYVVCAALRLARFNVQGAVKEKNYFQGIPSPGAAGMIVSTVLFHQEYWSGRLSFMPTKIVFLLIVFMLALLMVSGVRYRTFKNFSLKGLKPFRALIVGALVMTFFAFRPELFLFMVGIVHTSAGLIENFFFMKTYDVLPREDEDHDHDGHEHEHVHNHDDQDPPNNVTALPTSDV